METLDNRVEINGAQWQKLDLKQEINTALSAYTASELALKEKKSVWSCWVVGLVGWEKVSGHLFCYCWVFACLSIWQHRKKPAYNASLAYFTVVNMFLIIPFDPTGILNAVEVTFWLKGIILSKSCQNKQIELYWHSSWVGFN